jgi:hypothetical protein
MLLLVGMAVFSIIGCKTGEKQVKQTSPEEQAIFQLFADMETVWNQQDADTYITFWHEDLKLKLGSPQSPKYYTKAEYAEVLPQRMADMGPFKMVKPKILKIDGEKAKASVVVRKKHRDYKNVFNLVQVNEDWQIISNEW